MCDKGELRARAAKAFNLVSHLLPESFGVMLPDHWDWQVLTPVICLARRHTLYLFLAGGLVVGSENFSEPTPKVAC